LVTWFPSVTILALCTFCAVGAPAGGMSASSSERLIGGRVIFRTTSCRHDPAGGTEARLIAKLPAHNPLDLDDVLRYSTHMSDPLDHPDLNDIGRTLQRRFDRILESEQAAAEVLARRTTGIRDRLIDCEDCAGFVTVTTVSGAAASGLVAAVASDHVELRLDGVSTLVAFDQIAMVALP
jgi:hypothetical protein